MKKTTVAVSIIFLFLVLFATPSPAPYKDWPTAKNDKMELKKKLLKDKQALKREFMFLSPEDKKAFLKGYQQLSPKEKKKAQSLLFEMKEEMPEEKAFLKDFIDNIKQVSPADRPEALASLKQIRAELALLSPEAKAERLATYRTELKGLDAKLPGLEGEERVSTEKHLERLKFSVQVLEETIAVPVLPPITAEVRPSTPPLKKPRDPFYKGNPLSNFSLGYFAGIPAASLSLQYFNLFRQFSVSGRVGITYAQGQDRKNALISLDGLYHPEADYLLGLHSYVGAGVNYNAYTTGQKSGAFGGQLFCGLEGESPSGIYFLEIGYGALRTGFSPSFKGSTLQVGFKY